ncbi:MAG: alpha amylase C-terminal domain-containing protein [Chloroflexia bacterium]
MPLTQDFIKSDTPMGANLAPDGATFRVWAPRAEAVHVLYDGNWDPVEANRMLKDDSGIWAGYVHGVRDGAMYMFYVVGTGSRGCKRDPYAREIASTRDGERCVLRDPNAYPWHDGFNRPEFSEMVVYQLHVGTFYVPDARADGGNFLDILDKLDYLAALGVNTIEPLPVVEFPSAFSMGYNGTDLFAPETQYSTKDPAQLDHYLQTANALLARRGLAPLTLENLQGAANQLRVLVDVCHACGMAVILDVVYNHAGGGFDDESIYFFDRMPTGNNNDSLYFTDQGWAGGLVFAYWNQGVRQFLIDNARYFLREYRVDGFRYDEVSVIVSHSDRGWSFCQDLTGTVDFESNSAAQIAEHWPVNPWVVKNASEGGAGFHATWDDGMRDSVRRAVSQAAGGRDSHVNLDPIADALRRPHQSLGDEWKGVEYLESHDEVLKGREPRMAALCDPTNSRSWYARSRARVAEGLLLTAPGIPMLFMGQEFLEDKQWSDYLPDALGQLIWWGGLDAGDKTMVDYLRFTRELIWLRRRLPGLRGGGLDVFHVHDDNRIIAFHRWVEGEGHDVVVVASLNESTFYGYELGFPGDGQWQEVFNSDVYDNWVNPQTTGNGGAITAGGPPMHGLPNSASIVIPANGILVFARG